MDSAAPASRDTASLGDWHARFGHPLAAYFRRRGVGAGECDDLAQEVFVRLAERTDIAEVRFPDRYVQRVAAHVLADWRRRGRARGAGLHAAIDDVPEIGDDAPSPERVALGRHALDQLRAAVARMPERTATIFTLHHFEQLPYAAIGHRCGVAVRTVEDHMARANLFLLAALEQPE